MICEFDRPLKVYIDSTHAACKYVIQDATGEEVASGHDESYIQGLIDAVHEHPQLLTALKELLNVSHRLEGCPRPDCHPCKENRKAIDGANKIIKDIEGT